MKRDGIHPRLLAVTSAVDDWCRQYDVNYDIACDESDLQGIRLFHKNRSIINGLLSHIMPFVDKNNVHVEHEKVRGGYIIAFSLQALTESQFRRIIENAGEEIVAMTFQERIEDAFTRQIIPTHNNNKKSIGEFFDSATAILYGKREQELPPPRKQIQRAVDFAGKISSVFGIQHTDKNDFRKKLLEALDGMAVPTQQQPSDLFAKFAQALKVLGDQMGIGPLQDVLKQQGIKWKKSDDGSNIILYIVNAKTNAPQPIARVSAETLDSPGDFEEQLTNMLDFAKGDAPGSFKQRQQEIKDQEQAVREIARAVAPEQDTEVARQMSAAPTSAAVDTAAATAATPKVGI